MVHWLLVRYEDLYGALGGFTADGALVNLLGTTLTHTHVATGDQCHLQGGIHADNTDLVVLSTG